MRGAARRTSTLLRRHHSRRATATHNPLPPNHCLVLTFRSSRHGYAHLFSIFPRRVATRLNSNVRSTRPSDDGTPETLSCDLALPPKPTQFCSRAPSAVALARNCNPLVFSVAAAPWRCAQRPRNPNWLLPRPPISPTPQLPPSQVSRRPVSSNSCPWFRSAVHRVSVFTQS